LVVEELQRRRPAERSSPLFPDASRYRLRHAYLRALPARVIDELMGHAATRRSSWAAEGASAMGAVYRHTTTTMEARVLQVLDTRLAEAVAVVEASG
jgi:hypothetical protein